MAGKSNIQQLQLLQSILVWLARQHIQLGYVLTPSRFTRRLVLSFN
jgi:hypothetical protein